MSANSTKAWWRDLESFSFGDDGEMADRLLAYVLAGAKTATCWPVREGQLTQVGKQMIVNDGQGHPCAVIETLSLKQKQFEEVDFAFALAEGEGFKSLQEWRDGHRNYFARHGGFEPGMMLWCEHFKLVEVIAENERKEARKLPSP